MEIESINPVVTVEIECDSYVPVIIRFDGYEGPISWVPKYWRTGDFKRSLIEIGMNPNSGAICKIVLTLLCDVVSHPIAGEATSERSGLPIAAMSPWRDGQSRVDIKQVIANALTENELTVLFGVREFAELDKVMCGRVAFLIDRQARLCGLQVVRLNSQEIDNLRFSLNLPSDLRGL